MQRTTIMLPEALKRRANQRAAAQGVSLGKFIRKAIAADLERGPVVSASDPLFSDAEGFAGEAPTDLAANHDHHLYGEQS